ncbi:hypothetical protein PUNSTDRAFT_136998 [Punctularia strigosozonata HHB-11173 SS5]|uniref:uncharacterized protein n=1 Tax=Punctularia strigosozonata (strain HHB-11173) TaxID=741275 RepID=UPI00044171E1|nr:uncharacterized protein PUNSTDRAFT_136998 [Punctularia strigosozonata HHB-11173 SS5]EIN06210.1 hypothetical protein PUNSTDRAFT_136998 [Punctularia strigosozonata HHB-11173 SS5]
MAVSVPIKAAEQADEALLLEQWITISVIALFAYEYVITLSDEVDRAWNKRWSLAIILFFLNRYYSLFEIFSVAVISFNPAWFNAVGSYFCVLSWMRAIDPFRNVIGVNSCTHFVKFQGAGSSVAVGIGEALMILRVHAIYQNRLVAVALSLCLAGQIILQIIVVSQGFALFEPTGGCVLVTKTSAYWIAPLVTESLIFILTMWRLRLYFRRGASMPAMRLFLRDGVAYFLVVFTANLINAIIFLTAQPSRKEIFAAVSQVVTSITASRLYLNLKGFYSPPQDLPDVSQAIEGGPITFGRRSEKRSEQDPRDWHTFNDYYNPYAANVGIASEPGEIPLTNMRHTRSHDPESDSPHTGSVV